MFDNLCLATNRGFEDGAGWVDSDMREAIRRQSNNRTYDFPISEQKAFTQRAIDIRAKSLRANSKFLVPLFMSLGQYDEESNDIVSAENNYLKAAALNSDFGTQASDSQNMASFYLRHHQTAKAMDSWRRHATLAAKNHLNYYMTGEVSLLKEFKEDGHPEFTKEMLDTMFANATADILKGLDFYLIDLVDECIKDLQFKRAEEVIKQRLAAATAANFNDNFNDWKIKLSALYLAEGRVKESDALFNQVVGSIALQGLPTADLKQQRAKLLERLGKVKSMASQ